MHYILDIVKIEVKMEFCFLFSKFQVGDFSIHSKVSETRCYSLKFSVTSHSANKQLFIYLRWIWNKPVMNCCISDTKNHTFCPFVDLSAIHWYKTQALLCVCRSASFRYIFIFAQTLPISSYLNNCKFSFRRSPLQIPDVYGTSAFYGVIYQ